MISIIKIYIQLIRLSFIHRQQLNIDYNIKFYITILLQSYKGWKTSRAYKLQEISFTNWSLAWIRLLWESI